MSDPAQSQGMMNNLRSSFATSPAFSQPAASTQVDPAPVSDALVTADQVLTEVEAVAQQASVLPQVVPTVVAQTTDTLNPAYAGPTAKESLEGTSAPDVHAIDANVGVQYVEQEHTPEIPVEVENFIQKVEDHHAQLPTEIVIADGTVPVPQPHFPTHKVVVLPITPAVEQEGEKKNENWSVKWLVEWSHKVMKMFTGHVIYRQ